MRFLNFYCGTSVWLLDSRNFQVFLSYLASCLTCRAFFLIGIHIEPRSFSVIPFTEKQHLKKPNLNLKLSFNSAYDNTPKFQLHQYWMIFLCLVVLFQTLGCSIYRCFLLLIWNNLIIKLCYTHTYTIVYTFSFYKVLLSIKRKNPKPHHVWKKISHLCLSVYQR